MADQSGNKVRFIRVRGKVVPIKEKGNGGGSSGESPKKSKKMKYTVHEKVSAGERYKSGFKIGAVVGAGASVGSVLMNMKRLKANKFKAATTAGVALGAGINMLAHGAIGGAIGAAFGQRYKKKTRSKKRD